MAKLKLEKVEKYFQRESEIAHDSGCEKMKGDASIYRQKTGTKKEKIHV